MAVAAIVVEPSSINSLNDALDESLLGSSMLMTTELIPLGESRSIAFQVALAWLGNEPDQTTVRATRIALSNSG